MQLMVTGAHGSHGEIALLLVVVERGHVSVSVTVRLQATVAGCVQETPLSCPDVAVRPAQVSHFSQDAYIAYVCSRVQ